MRLKTKAENKAEKAFFSAKITPIKYKKKEFKN
jgi:hypothetical protein